MNWRNFGLFVFTLAGLAGAGQLHAQFTIATNNAGITITSYTGFGGHVDIPRETNGLPVLRIGANAFCDRTGLYSVTIPDSVTVIESNAFSYCSKLTNVVIPNSVVTIGIAAFQFCSAMTNIVLSTNLAAIPPNAFANCGVLRRINIPDSVTAIGSGAFNHDSRLGTVTMGNRITNIGASAFSYTSFTNFTVPKNVMSVDDAAFAWCSALTNVTFPETLQRLGQSMFTDDVNLRRVFFLGNAPQLPQQPYLGGNAKTVVTCIHGTTGWDQFVAATGCQFAEVQRPNIATQDPAFGVKSGRFTFPVGWATNDQMVVEYCTNLVNPIWFPIFNGWVNESRIFSEPVTSPSRFYRVRRP